MVHSMTAFARVEDRPRRPYDPSAGYVENFLHMCFGDSPVATDPAMVHALETLLVLHADHEQNCSTATLRLVSSSNAGFFSSVSAALSALWGPLHGGANQAVIEMLQAIPSGYLEYFYLESQVVARQARGVQTRAEVVMDVERRLMERYSDPHLCEKPAELIEDIRFRSAIWPNCRSSGAVTVDDMTSGLAPG